MAYIDFQLINQNQKLKLFFFNEQIAISNNFSDFFFLIPNPTYMNNIPQKIYFEIFITSSKLMSLKLDSQNFCTISNSHHDQKKIFFQNFFIISQQKASKKVIFNKIFNM